MEESSSKKEVNMDRRFFSDRVPKLKGDEVEAEDFCQKLFFPVAALAGWSEETGSLFLNLYRPREVATVFALVLCDALGERRAVMRKLFTEEARALLCRNAEEVTRAQRMVEGAALRALKEFLNLPEEVKEVKDSALLDRIATIVAYAVCRYLCTEERELVREQKERMEALAQDVAEALDAGHIVFAKDDKVVVKIRKLGAVRLRRAIRVNIFP